MYKHITLIVLCLVQGYHFLDRNEIISEYQPILTEKAANITIEYNTVSTEVTIITNLIKNNTRDTVALINTQITSLKITITNAKTASANKTSVLNCLSVQETAAAKLTAVPINATCWVNVTYPDLTNAKNALATLARIPNNTISACTTLNPLPIQDGLFLTCIADKIFDLDQQIQILLNDFDSAREQTIDGSVECLAGQSALVAEEIDEISLQVTLCVTLG